MTWNNKKKTLRRSRSYKPVEREDISTIEAIHIWDNINVRYDQLQINKIFAALVHDSDLKMILQRGESMLNKQIQVLTEKANQYEIPLPERPPAVKKINIDPEVIQDDFAYRFILKGIQDTINLYLRSVIETIRNDELREIFYNYYKKEVGIFDDFLRYGKLKGWTHILPIQKNT